ncbi:MAG: glycosyltransferase [Eubacteriales bacterium]|nr:glycosyltransferase [Eubacteriales bacterium]
MHRFSIIIPCYNVEAYLESCIESIEKQGFKDYEIVLINDGSTDGTDRLSELLKDKYSNIRYFKKENGGLSNTRNFGLERSEAEYVYFLDSDDLLDEASLENINDCIEENGFPDVIVTRYRELDDRTGALGEKTSFPENLNEAMTSADKYSACYLYNDIKPMASISVVKRSYLVNKGLYFKEKIVHEDELWTPQVLLGTENLCFLDKSCYIYRVNRKGSIMNKITEKHILDRLKIINELEDLAEKDSKNSPMYLSRCACILNGILGMKVDNISEETVKAIKNKSYLFRKSVQKKYLIIYLMLSLLGVKTSMKLVRFISSK